MTLAPSQIMTLAGAGLAVLVGFVDAETTAHLGVDWDRSLIALGIGTVLGVAAPATARVAGAMLKRSAPVD
jgi:hypothetical protein